MLGLGSLSPDMMWGEGQDELLGGPSFGDIVRAVEWQESRGKDDAVSPKGAFGAMQLMTGATIDYARAHGLPTDPASIEQLRRDPIKNREIGAWYLKQAQDQFGGELVPALAAYNAGPGRVKRILAGLGGEYSPEIEADFIAQLPAETRDYIAKIRGRLDQPSNGAPSMQNEMMGRPPTPEEQAARALVMSAPGVQDGIERDWQPEVRAGGAGVSALQPRPQAQGLSALSPYLQIAQQLMPQRESRPWADALINAGAAMMQSNRPDFLGGLGAGLQAGNQALAQGRNAERQDTLDRFKLGMQLAQYDQKDGGEYAMSDGVLYNKKTGQTRQVGGDKPMSDVGKLQSDLRAGRITPEEYEAALAKVRRDGESPIERIIGEMGIDRNGPQAQELRRKYAERVGGGATVNIDNKAETEFARKLAGAQAEAYTNAQKGAAEAISSNARLDRMSQLLEGVQTGKYSTSLMELQKGLSTILGKNAPTIFGKPAEVAQAEAASALANEIALTLRNPAGGAGMPGAMSDADRQFLQSMVPGLETTPPGRKMMIETAKALNKRAVEVARLMAEYRKSNNNSLDGWELYLADWSEKNPLFAGVAVPEVPPPTGGPPPPAAGNARELPPSDADIRRQQQQQAPAQPQSGGGIIPSPKRFELGGPKVGAQPQGDIPTFTDPNDPALAKLPSGSVFRDGSGTLRYKP